MSGWLEWVEPCERCGVNHSEPLRMRGPFAGYCYGAASRRFVDPDSELFVIEGHRGQRLVLTAQDVMDHLPTILAGETDE